MPLAADVDRSVIELKVDAHEAPRRLFHAKLTIPARPGPMTLVYPKWIQGEHGPNGPINDLTGLKITAGDKSIPWRRDDVDLYAFHITVPAEADAIEVSLDYLGPASKEASTYTSLPTTPSLAIVHWYTLLLYPQGQPVREIKFHAKLTVPDGWKSGTALPIENEIGNYHHLPNGFARNAGRFAGPLRPVFPRNSAGNGLRGRAFAGRCLR